MTSEFPPASGACAAPLGDRCVNGLRRARSVAGLAAVALSCWVGCRSQGSPTEAVAASGAPAASEGPTRVEPTPKATGSELAIIELGPGRFALSARSAVEINAEAHIEQRSATGAFAPLSLEGGFRLTESCQKPTPPASNCRALQSGETLIPRAWNGASCAGACCPDEPGLASSATPPEHTGVHRVVIARCAAPSIRWEGPEFELPSSRGALHRARAAAHIETASVIQLHATNVVDSVTQSPGRVAGVAVVEGSEAQLDSEQVIELGRFLRGSGFDDRVVRRCKREDAFGFRVVRKAPGLAPEATEVAIDLNCNSIAVVHQEGTQWLRSDAFFDASRPALIALLKKALPAALPASATQ